jgi:hypothetical protein
MELAEGWRHVVVDAGNEGDARHARDGGAHSARVSYGDEQRGEHSEPGYAEECGASADGLEHAAARVHGFRGDERQ